MTHGLYDPPMAGIYNPVLSGAFRSDRRDDGISA